ncbi:MAG: DUF502 domain-containing protein [Phycisphaerae bacterium]|jgi:uncharacterized membrane protein|nr:DUF502 domain-containing protein [Phycisphaerae bacterium]MCZ2401037.1 DUF502 domain-containing protein [Phycisphaerae bacterium]NUQ50648.1 DUF502 domain-containing protein [Phycisphaerae bacterium]
MTAPNPTESPPRPPLTGLKTLLRTRVSAGLLTVLPVYITYLVVSFIFVLMRDTSQWLIVLMLRPPLGDPFLKAWGFDFENWHALQAKLSELGLTPTGDQFMQFLPWGVQWAVPLLAVLLTVFLLYFVGLLAANMIGRRLINFFENLLERLPLIKTVYRALKQILASFSGDTQKNFQRVALIPFPDARMRAVGFVTNTFRDSVSGEDLVSVFIPTTPNPTTGFLQVLKRGEISEMNWTVEEGVRMIMSGGILKPEYLTTVLNRDLPKAITAGDRRYEMPIASEEDAPAPP